MRYIRLYWCLNSKKLEIVIGAIKFYSSFGSGYHSFFSGGNLRINLTFFKVRFLIIRGFCLSPLIVKFFIWESFIVIIFILAFSSVIFYPSPCQKAILCFQPIFIKKYNIQKINCFPSIVLKLSYLSVDVLKKLI